MVTVTFSGDDLRGALRGAFSRHDAALASAPRSQRTSSSSRTRTHRPMRRARRLPFLISWRIVHSDSPERFATSETGLMVGSVATVIWRPLEFGCPSAFRKDCDPGTNANGARSTCRASRASSSSTPLGSLLATSYCGLASYYYTTVIPCPSRGVVNGCCVVMLSTNSVDPLASSHPYTVPTNGHFFPCLSSSTSSKLPVQRRVTRLHII